MDDKQRKERRDEIRDALFRWVGFICITWLISAIIGMGFGLGYRLIV